MDVDMLKAVGFALPDDVREQINIAYGHLWRAHSRLLGEKRNRTGADMFQDFAIGRIDSSLKELGWLGFGGEDELE